MVDLSIDQGNLLVRVRGWSKLWTFKSRLRFPLSQIKAVRWDPAAVKGWWKGWRVPGIRIPGVIIAGTFYRDGGQDFWDVRDGSRAVTIELEGSQYGRLVVDVADPQGTVAMIGEALRLSNRQDR
jgi:hypothetical protein